MSYLRRSVWIFVTVFALGATRGRACSALEEPSAKRMVDTADVIVRVTAMEALTVPQLRGAKVVGGPIEVIRFRADETVKGTNELTEVMLWGWPVEHDDFNENRVPYKRVRSDGLKGSCSAHEFKLGGMYLLLLQKQDLADGLDYTSSWYALAPTAEQLRSSDDRWLQWVRKRAKRTMRLNYAVAADCNAQLKFGKSVNISACALQPLNRAR